MPRQITGKETQKDRNAIKQQTLTENLNFWNHEISSRRFIFDYPIGSEEIQSVKLDFNTLILAIFYKKRWEKDAPLSIQSFIKKKLPKSSAPCVFEKFDAFYQIYINEIESYNRIIRSIMDTFLNMTEENPINKLDFYVKCDAFYIENIKDSLLNLKNICSKYGLYPYQLFESNNMADLILNYEDSLCMSSNVFFLKKPDPLPPILFNYGDETKNFYEKERPDKFYFYWDMSRNQDIEKLSKEVIDLAEQFKSGEYKIEDDCHKPTGIQICIDVFNQDYDYNRCAIHLKVEMQNWKFCYQEKIQFFVHTDFLKNKNIKKSIDKTLALEYSKQRKKEYESIQVSHICQGGYNTKLNNLSLLCGFYIWDLELFYNIPSKMSENILSNDTKQSIKNEELVKNNITDAIHNEIMLVKDFLEELGHNMKRTAINQNYRSAKGLISNCLRHPLYRKK